MKYGIRIWNVELFGKFKATAENAIFALQDSMVLAGFHALAMPLRV